MRVVPFLAFLFGGLVSMYLVGRVAEFLQSLLREGLFRKDREWEDYEDYLQSRTWKKKRQTVMGRSGGLREAKGCGSEAEHVHHKKYPSRWGEETPDMLKALCRPCHNDEHPQRRASGEARHVGRPTRRTPGTQEAVTSPP